MRLITYCCIVFLVATGSAWAVQYTVTNLGTLGGTSSGAAGMNESGQVVGSSTTREGYEHAFLYSNGTMTDLGTFGGNYSFAVGINNNGQVVGNATNANGDKHAFLYDINQRTMTDLGTLGGSFSEAYGINDSGQIVGWSDNAQGQRRAFLYSNGVMSTLGNFAGAPLNPPNPIGFLPPSSTGAWAIGNNGEIAGYVCTPDGYYHAALYSMTDNTITDIGTLGGDDSNVGWNCINDEGDLAGSAGLTGSVGFSAPWHAFLYSNGNMTDLGTLGSDFSEGKDVNNLGQVVGESYTAAGSLHGFIYSNGSMTDLNSLINPASRLSIAWTTSINDDGQIAATAFNAQGQGRAVLLTLGEGPPPPPSTVPEPGTIAMMATALLGFAGIYARRIRGMRN